MCETAQKMVIFLFIITSSILVANSTESSKFVVGEIGETVTLPCKYDIDVHGILNICWGRHQSWFSCENTLISTEGLHVNYRESPRFSLSSGLKRGNISLTIKVAQKWDSGQYVCRVEIPGPFNDISHNVYLFISNRLDMQKVNTVTQLAPTVAKQEKQVYYVSVPSSVTELYIRPETITTADTDVYIAEPVAVVHTEETIETFVINVVRAGAVVFIPGLIIAFLFRLRRSGEQNPSR